MRVEATVEAGADNMAEIKIFGLGENWKPLWKDAGAKYDETDEQKLSWVNRLWSVGKYRTYINWLQ